MADGVRLRRLVKAVRCIQVQSEFHEGYGVAGQLEAVQHIRLIAGIY